jgi:hypothetical protein
MCVIIPSLVQDATPIVLSDVCSSQARLVFWAKDCNKLAKDLVEQIAMRIAAR